MVQIGVLSALWPYIQTDSNTAFSRLKYCLYPIAIVIAEELVAYQTVYNARE
ncbi:MAG: hypothetical protein JRJ17_08630 [Deltaproteobacteria bacterium]|nr:hypothetical protein [Deltaproteobacteria bacterium]